MATFLSEEMLQEIMSWLPPESLIRFKCVCKSWYALISSLMDDSTFVAKHLGNIENKILPSKTSNSLLIKYTTSKSKPEHHLVVTCLVAVSGDHDHDDVDNDYIPCDIQELFSLDDELNLFVDVVFHCNGIICLFVCHLNLIVLSNPAIGQFKFIPKPCLVDSIELLGIGFGYDSRTDDYKVVAIECPTRASSPCRAKVFTLSTNSWRDVTLNIEIDYFPTPIEHQVVYCKGVCYWYYWNWDVKDLLTFDFHDEVFRNILLPDDIKALADYSENLAGMSKIAVWNESVALLFFCEEDPVVLDMWVMDDSGADEKGSSCWTKCMTIGPIAGVKYPVSFWSDDELLMESEDREIVSYNLSTRKLRHFPVDSMYSRAALAVTCVKSLVSVLSRGNDEVDSGDESDYLSL